jgi:hypothetical protein
MFNRVKFQLLYIVLILGVFITGCETINPSEEIPSYIEISEIPVNEDFSAVTDAWVYIDDYLIGCYDLPAHFPVLRSGNVELTVRPGIRVNGIAVTRGFYSFYEEWSTDVNLIEGETTVLNPNTEYKSGLTFEWEENFESIALTIEPFDTTDLNFSRVDTVSDAPSGRVGAVKILPDSVFAVQSTEQFTLPSSGDVYLELSFKADVSFELAWRAENIETTIIRHNQLYVFNPASEWQHVYIFLGNFIDDYNASLNRFRFLFGAINLDDGPKHIYIDNIKLIHSN